jgi:hypothetical protein
VRLREDSREWAGGGASHLYAADTDGHQGAELEQFQPDGPGCRVEVIELVPPWVQTEFTPGQSTREGYMPLDGFIDEAMALFQLGATPRRYWWSASVSSARRNATAVSIR